MKIEYSDLPEAQSCLNVINDLQLRFTNGIQSFGEIKPNEILWYRNDGKNGGGRRFEFLDSSFISSASINVSQVHYELNDKIKLLLLLHYRPLFTRFILLIHHYIYILV